MAVVQAIKCKCGKIFAACQEPECYTEKEWQKDLRKYVKGGCAVVMIDTKAFRFEECQCEKTGATPEQPTLFDLLAKS